MIAITVTFVLAVLAISGSFFFVYRASTFDSTARARLLAIQEKRRILERDRKEWQGALSSDSRQNRISGTKNLKLIDDKLLDLADEEADMRARLYRSGKEKPDDGNETRQDSKPD